MEWLPELHKQQATNKKYSRYADGTEGQPKKTDESGADTEEDNGSNASEGAVMDSGVDMTSADAEEEDDDPIKFALHDGIDLSAQYWGPTRDITEEALTDLMKKHVATKDKEPNTDTCVLISRQHGVYNSGYILQLHTGERVCVRVPACGWGKRWNPYDSELLRQTALTMKMLEEKTQVPLAKVIAYDCSQENAIGAPFIILSCVSGTGARQVWNAEEGPVPREARRQNMLRTIAQAMAGLRHLKYPKSGSLWFGDDITEEPVVGESWNPKMEGYLIKRDFEIVKSYCSTQYKVTKDLQRLLDDNSFPDNCQDLSTQGGLELYRLITRAFLAATKASGIGSEEEFVIFHRDFDIQNMMVDQEGNLMGILDWDGLSCQPRQVGWSMVPFWLQEDWYPSHEWPPAIGANYAMVRPNEFEKYRQDYARYLWDACDGVGDCRFTTKSHIYRAFLNSTSDRFSAMRFVENVLADILPRSPAKAYCTQIGQYGFRSGEQEWLEARLLEFFRPEPPRGVAPKSGEAMKPNKFGDVATTWLQRCSECVKDVIERVLHLFR